MSNEYFSSPIFRGRTEDKNRELVYGNEITFGILIFNEDQEAIDPTTLTFVLYRKPIEPLTRLYDISDIEHVSTGLYRVTLNIPPYIVPGMYTAAWEFGDGSETGFVYEQLYVIDPPLKDIDRYDPPRLVGNITEALQFDDMGLGNTDAILLVGHADGLTINDPFPVRDMQEAIDMLQADLSSPLLRALLEAYDTGCRDIHILATAPMREYADLVIDRSEVKPEWGNRNFYERYAQRLEETYRILASCDEYDIVVPLEAPFIDALGVDFFSPLVKLCADILTITNKPVLGIMGTRWDAITNEQIEDAINDERLAAIHEDSYLTEGAKMVLIVFGEGVIKLPFLSEVIYGSGSIAAAAYLSASSLQRGLTYTKVKNMTTLKGNDLSKDQVTRLARARINPLIRTALGKRGAPNNVVFATDHTQAPPGSDYWSVVQMRLVTRVIRDIRNMSIDAIGTTGYALLKERIKTYFAELQRTNYIRQYSFDIQRSSTDYGTIAIDIILWPRLGVNDIKFKVHVGPQTPGNAISEYQLGQDYMFNPQLAQIIPDGDLDGGDPFSDDEPIDGGTP